MTTATDIQAPNAVDDSAWRSGLNTQVFEMSVDEVICGLMAVSKEFPATNFAMQIAKAMLVKMDTLRDEMKLRATLGKSHLNGSHDKHLGQLLSDISEMAGGRGDKRGLYVDSVHCPACFDVHQQGGAA